MLNDHNKYIYPVTNIEDLYPTNFKYNGEEIKTLWNKYIYPVTNNGEEIKTLWNKYINKKKETKDA